MATPPEPTPRLGQAFGAMAVSTITAGAHANYYKTLVASGIEPEIAREMTTQAIGLLLQSADQIICAVGEAAKGLAPIVEAVNKMIDTDFAKELLRLVSEEPRR